MRRINPKLKLKGTCCICSDPVYALFNTKKYCKRCRNLKKYSGLTDKELIKEYR